uniref:CENP-V/GFA domain-containing protein n=1 Tax=Oryza punctata TaxID=4537 RepID=A0A0E0LZ44_ORYPU
MEINKIQHKIGANDLDPFIEDRWEEGADLGRSPERENAALPTPSRSVMNPARRRRLLARARRSSAPYPAAFSRSPAGQPGAAAFCKFCGITSFYTPWSNPDGVACVNLGTLAHIEYRHADGRNWEKWKPYTAKFCNDRSSNCKLAM